MQIINSAVLPWITPSLLKYCPPQAAEIYQSADSDPDLAWALVQADYDFLEESCTLIESLALDVEDFRLELASATCHSEKVRPISCLQALLEFIELGSYPPIWKGSVYEESERRSKEKGFDICKAALIKAVVEVFGEEKNEETLWKGDKHDQPGGELVAKMVQWVKDYAEALDSKSTPGKGARDDMSICASLSLGNLARKGRIPILLVQ